MRPANGMFALAVTVVSVAAGASAWSATTPATASTAHPPPPALPPAEQSIVNVFKRVSPSVVSVANKAILRDLFDSSLYEVPQGAGTGFVWDKEGHIISNFHVIYGASSIQVTFSDGTTHNADVVGMDPDEDIAVLKIAPPKTPLIPVEPGRSADLQVGQTVLAIGNPFGLDTSLSVGVVSALGRNITSMSQRLINNVIQTDAAINPGNSGGPLLDSSGRLIGMNTAIVSPSGAYAGIGFAVPVDTIRRAVPQLIKTGRVQRPALGIRMVPRALSRRADVEKGVAILSVAPGSAADRANLKGIRQTRGGVLLGDIILDIDGAAMNSEEDVSAAIDRHQVGDEIRLTVQRGNDLRTVTVKLRAAE